MSDETPVDLLCCCRCSDAVVFKDVPVDILRMFLLIYCSNGVSCKACLVGCGCSGPDLV